MAEYIERENYCKRVCPCDNERCGRDSCTIWKAPAADVAPVVHGRWEEYQLRCSACGYVIPAAGRDYRCCPMCGARMEEEDEYD